MQLIDERRLPSANRHEAERQRAQRSNRRKKKVDNFNRRVTRTLDHQKIAFACGQMFEQFGGPVGFVKELARQYESAPAGSALRVHTLNSLIRMCEYVDANRPKNEIPELMTDEDLERLQRAWLHGTGRPSPSQTDPRINRPPFSRANQAGNNGNAFRARGKNLVPSRWSPRSNGDCLQRRFRIR